jgi:hypothetical protein
MPQKPPLAMNASEPSLLKSWHKAKIVDLWLHENVARAIWGDDWIVIHVAKRLLDPGISLSLHRSHRTVSPLSDLEFEYASLGAH